MLNYKDIKNPCGEIPMIKYKDLTLSKRVGPNTLEIIDNPDDQDDIYFIINMRPEYGHLYATNHANYYRVQITHEHGCLGLNTVTDSNIINSIKEKINNYL